MKNTSLSRTIRTTWITVCAAGSLAVMLPQHSLAADSHKGRIVAYRTQIEEKLNRLRSKAKEVDAELAQRGENTKLSSTLQKELDALNSSAAWRWHVEARDSHKQAQAKQQIARMLKAAESIVSAGSGRLAAYKKAEYAAWAREHPEEARKKEESQQLFIISGQKPAWMHRSGATTHCTCGGSKHGCGDHCSLCFTRHTCDNPCPMQGLRVKEALKYSDEIFKMKYGGQKP